uniref:Uncharacterized protein n=1 Tax=Catagonus wagneri TaxID=51154 RepID=A0A8C3YW02_9CETA
MEPAVFKALDSAEKPKLEDENLIFFFFFFFCLFGLQTTQAMQVAQDLGYIGQNCEGAYKEWFHKEG